MLFIGNSSVDYLAFGRENAMIVLPAVQRTGLRSVHQGAEVSQLLQIWSKVLFVAVVLASNALFFWNPETRPDTLIASIFGRPAASEKNEASVVILRSKSKDIRSYGYSLPQQKALPKD